MKRFLLSTLTVLGLGFVALAARFVSPPLVPGVGKSVAHAFGPLHPSISPDGANIAFSYQGAIWRMPCRGGVMRRLSKGDGYDIEPIWSPDGTRIAYVNSPNSASGELRLVDAKDGTPVPLAKSVRVAQAYGSSKISFDVEGRRVFGFLQPDGGKAGLAWYELNSGAVTSVAPIARLGRYALSNDAKWIGYSIQPDVPGQQTGNDGERVQLWKRAVDDGTPVSLGQFPARIYDICWGADDLGLYVVADAGGAHYDLWYAPLDNLERSLVKLTFGSADETQPSFSRDGRWLAYLDNRECSTALVIRDQTTELDETVSVTGRDYAAPTGTLRLKISDRQVIGPVTARISIEEEQGKFYAPAGSLYRILDGYAHFYCAGSAELTLPAGKYRLRVLHGPEVRAAHLEFQIEPGKPLDLEVPLERWTHMAKKGWFSGENHIHANYGLGEWYNTPRTMFEQSAGEDLNVSNFMVSNSDGDGVFDREFFRGGLDPLSTETTLLYWNEEFRSTIWGHMTLVNLRQIVEPLFTGFKESTHPWDVPTNGDVADLTHWQKGIVNYTHAAGNVNDPYAGPYAAKGLPVDVALGKIDTLDVNYSYAATLPLWYRLLNCGFRLPASAGTDCFLNRVSSRLPGADRVYVKVDGPLTYPNWIDGLRAGRSFVTNGPMLEFSVDAQGSGSTLRLSGPGSVRVVAEAAAQFPLSRMEVYYNGKVAAEGRLSEDKLRGTVDEKIRIERSGWIGIRATGPGHRDHPVGEQNAQTSPVYVEVAGRPAGSREDAEFFMNWIERHSTELRVRDRFPNDELRQHVRQQYEAARAVYAKIARESE